MREAACLIALALLLVACPGDDGLFDFDGDGYIDIEDCDPEDASIHPGAPDPYGDGIDQDCDLCPEGAGDGVDTDCDGFPANIPTYDEDYDCDDANPNAYPGAEEIQGDGVDQDCDGEDCIDADLDGHCEGPADCDDDDPTSYLGAEEVPDGADNDCDGNVDEGTTAYDDDNDGSCEGADLDGDGGEDDCSDGSDPGDCDDSDAALNLVDQDSDGYDTCGGDCDDFDQDVHPGASEVCNGQDDDCDGEPAAGEADVDMDGFMICEGDCDDGNSAVTPADTDGDDGDASVFGLDEDGDGITMCAGDCNDGSVSIHPGAYDGWGNGVDEDCSGEDGIDWDGDGAVSNAVPPGLGTPEWDCDDLDAGANRLDADGDGVDTCAGDCDDSDPANFPGNIELADGQDNNCTGLIDGDDPGLMVEVPAGSFWMGCAPSDTSCGSNESPYHDVMLDAFFIDVTEVTVSAYGDCVSAGVCTAPGTSSDCNWGVSGREDHPVNCVDWYEAESYCAWAGKRLPAEAEWERAARGTDERIYPWGNTSPDCTLAQYYGCPGETIEVGSLPAGVSPYAVVDMSGNVWEWVSDWYDSSYYSSSPSSNPTGPSSGPSRVIRGGSWGSAAANLRASYRFGFSPSDSFVYVGFRCASAP